MTIKSTSIILFCNNHVGFKALQWLLQAQYTLAAVVTHTEKNSYFYQQIRQCVEAEKLPHFEYDPSRKSELVDFIHAHKSELGISAYFGYILGDEHITPFPLGIVNLHGGYLPWCRGKNPNAWTIVENAPAGVTMHLIDKEVDKGSLIAQTEIPMDWGMNAKSLYERMEQESLNLLKQYLPAYLDGSVGKREYSDAPGSYHSGAELSELKQIDLDSPTTARKLFNQLRAATFPPFQGATFTEDGVTYEVEVSINKVIE